MERFTEWFREHGAGRPGKDCYTQLALYEDSGLTPEEVSVLAKRDKPMKPVRVPVSNHGDETDGCPVCKCEFYSAHKFCPDCGQRIDWKRREKNDVGRDI